LTCSGIDPLPSFPGTSTISSPSRFVVEGAFRQSGVVHYDNDDSHYYYDDERHRDNDDSHNCFNYEFHSENDSHYHDVITIMMTVIINMIPVIVIMVTVNYFHDK
jgi:hypothetical protein